MSSLSDNQTPQSAAEFARHLRACAEQAAAASVQHAGLSERYLDLSRQLAALSEKVLATPAADLRKAMKTVESAMADSIQRMPLPAMDNRAAEHGAVRGFPQAETFSPTDDGSAWTATLSTLSELGGGASPLRTAVVSEGFPPVSTTPVEPDGAAPVKSASDNALAKRRRKRSARVETRTFVERVRSVKLGLTRRVKVKASKEDLQPQQRKVLQELNKGRGSILTSVTVISLALFILSLMSLQMEIDVPMTDIIASFADELTQREESLPVKIPEEEQGKQQEPLTEESVEEPFVEPEPNKEVDQVMDELTKKLLDAPESEVETGEIPSARNRVADLAAVDNRSGAGRQRMLAKFGGSAASESAVGRGLDWLASVQHPQGWWDFTQVGESGNPGRVNNPIGATSYALMPFLAAGQTHRDGRYAKQVQAGLEFLSGTGVSVPAGYDLRGVLNKANEDKEPNEAYYVHGTATLVLCEAYGMTREKRLRRPAEGALRFLLNSQDPREGGWRYLPQQPGSTSATVVQVMALMAAKKAKLKVPPETLDGVMHYLDSVQIDGEGRYGYEADRKTYKGSATAMALLCRMYLGWGRDDGDMRAGVSLLDKAGPYENLYTNYFATQVMRNWGGEEWTRWNERLRDDLIASQVGEGPGKGSWKPRTGMHTRQGGRLLETSLATLTLQVYYRYRPVLPQVGSIHQQVADDSTIP